MSTTMVKISTLASAEGTDPEWDSLSPPSLSFLGKQQERFLAVTSDSISAQDAAAVMAGICWGIRLKKNFKKTQTEEKLFKKKATMG